MAAIHVTVLAGPFKDILKGLEALNEQAVFEFDSTGMTVKCLDNDYTSVLRVKANEVLFSDYQFTAAQSPLKLGIVLERLKDITKTLTTKDILSLKYDSQNPQKAEVTASSRAAIFRVLNTETLDKVVADKGAFCCSF